MKIKAKLMLVDVENMKPSVRRRVAAWLKRQADDLIKDGDNYAPYFKSYYVLVRK